MRKRFELLLAVLLLVAAMLFSAFTLGPVVRQSGVQQMPSVTLAADSLPSQNFPVSMDIPVIGGMLTYYPDARTLTLVEKIDIYGQPIKYITLRNACPVNGWEAAAWFGGTADEWHSQMEGPNQIWVFKSGQARVLRSAFGRLQINDGTMIPGQQFIAHAATLRCQSHLDPRLPQVAGVPNCPVNQQAVAKVFNGALPLDKISGLLPDGGFQYNGPSFGPFTVAPGPMRVVSPAGTFTSGQQVPATTVFTFYCGRS